MNAKKNRNRQRLLALGILLLAAGLPAQTTGVSGDSTINQCETKTYTISVQNNSGNPLTNMIVTARLGNLPGFSYVTGTASIDVDGGAPFCTANPTFSGTDLVWNIDTQCSGPFTLNNGATLNIAFNLATDCSAVSGSLNIRIDYEIGGTPMFDETGVHSIQVLPGGLTIKKTPNVIPQEVGQDVTWTLTVENSGFGTIKNVVVTDVLGAGLAYVSSAPAGSNSGQTTTWGVAEVPQFASMNPGDTITMDITATVTACELLENNADARWGCDLATTCYDTATTVPPSTATASVQRIVKTPLIQYTPANITFDYCNDTASAGFTVSNLGDGRAHDVELCVDLAPLTVTAVTAPATYSGGCFIIPSLAAGETFNLEFTVQFNAWCSAFPSRSLVWITNYEDDCHNHFYPPVHLSSLSGPAVAPTLAVNKSGAPAIVQIGSQITYAITSSYSGPLTCGSGSTGTVTVVDSVPDGFTVVDAGGGTWVPGGGGTGGTITWTYAPPATLNTGITVQVPDRTQCETYCFTTFTNSISATAVDCCGCTLNASSSQTTAIECEELVDSEKTAVPGTGIRCGTIQYTNTYDFGNAGILLNTLTFREFAENQQQYVPGSLSVTYNGADITGCVVVTDTTPGGNLSLNFSGCAADVVNNKNLTIVYRLTITEATVAACGGATFYSWSGLNMGTTGSECLPDGIINEATVVAVDPPAMSLAITGLGQIVDKCQTQEITLTLAQTSGTANPRDVRLVLSGLNYYIVDPAVAACSGAVAPTSCTPALVGGDYVWYFTDGFNGSGQDAVIRLTVRKRCNNGGELSATAYFDDNCNDDAVYDDTCSATASATPALLLSGDLLIEKTPEIYYATTNTVEWKIYLTNRGSGSAYSVWLDDVLGAGLDYSSAVVNNMTGVTITADQDHNGGAINGCTVAISAMAAGQRREITLRALLIDCDNLTNAATSSWGCGGSDCQALVSDNSTVAIPRPLLINTNVITTPVAACADTQGMLTLKNSGQTTCYNLQLTATLPAGLLYIPGTTRWRLNGGGWNGPNAAYDPSPTVSPLRWTSTQIPGLASANPGDTIEVEYDLAADCPFTGGNVTVATSYENPCGQVFNTADSVFTVAFRAPQITITKTRANTPIDCNQDITWDITVTNNSGYAMPILWVEDTMDAAYAYVSSTGDAPYTSDNGTNVGQRVTWELENVPTGTTANLTLTAHTDTSPCSPGLDNTVRAWWGCGNPDGSSATKPGVDPPDNNLCLGSIAVSAVRTETRQPTVGYVSIALSPGSINSCNDNTEMTLTIANTGVTDARNVDLVVTLPAGLSYNAGSSLLCQGADDTCTTVGIGDPVIAGNVLTYYDIASKLTNLTNVLQANGGNDTLVLKFSVKSSCYMTQNVGLNLRYYDCCDDTQYSTSTNQPVISLFPDLSITKTPVTTATDCGTAVIWNVAVTNNGTGNAQVIRVEDTLGAWLTYVPGSFTTPDKPGTSIANLGGQVWAWEFNDLAAGASATFTLGSTLNPVGSPNQADCTTALRQNNVRAIWGCGTAGDATDNNPATTAYDCTTGTWSAAPVTTVLMPDLRITAITPGIACTTGDGVFSGSMSVTVQNQGTAPTLTGFTVSVTDGTWTGTGTTGVLAAGASVTVTIDTSGWAINCHSCVAYTLNATVDSTLAVCECNEANNTSSLSYTPQLPDLQVNSITPTCTADGRLRVRVNISNVGCASSGTFVLSLADDQGHSSTSNQAILAAGANRNVDFSNWVSACSPASVDFTATVDSTNTNCECTSVNSLTYTYANPLPNLEVTTITPSTSCTADGTISGTFAVQISNTGNGSISNDFRIQVNDGQGWTATPWYSATLGGTLPLAAGGNATVSIPWTRGFTTAPYTCSFPTITVTLDTTSVICECSNASNAATSSYAMTYPNLRITSVTPTCSSDGSYSVAVVVNNNGCGTASNAVVRLSDNDGQTSDQTVTLAAGASQTLTYAPWPADGNPATLTFTTTLDPGSAICELSGTDNTSTTNFTRGNLNLASITPACNSDGNFQVSLVIQNNGSAAINNNFVIRLADNDGHSLDQNFTAIGGTLPLAAGSQQTVVFSGWTVDCNPTTINFSGTLDPAGLICESNNGDNSNTGTITINDLQAVSVVPATSCSADGSISGTMVVTVANSGGNAISTDFRILVDDGQGWTSELFYNADLGGTLPIAPGASSSVTFNWTRAFTATTYVCSFPAITATVDSQNAICECTSGNNTNSATYSLSYPNLRVISVTPTCSSDGSYSVAVVVNNNGCATATNAVVRLSDDDGQTSDQTVTLAAGASQTLTYSPWPADGNPAALTFTASIDPAAAICELSGTDNSMTVTHDNPNLHIVSITPACLADGSYQVTMVIENNGSAAINADFVVRLADNDGHSVDQNFTAIGGTLPLTAGSQQTVAFNNWTVDCNPTTINFSGTLDPTNLVCESNSGDNTNTGAITINDLQAVSVVPATSCSSDGAITGTMVVTVANTGGNAINTDFRILVDDGQGWTSELFYNADLGGTLPIAPGASSSVTFNWTRAFTATTYVCSFPAITATVDSQNAICECTSGNNTNSATYSLSYPNLRVISVTPTCSSDGSYSVAVVVNNNGCATATNAVVRLSDNDGHTSDQTATLAVGASQTLTYAPWPADGNPAALTFTAIIDPAAAICELTGDEHSQVVTYNNSNLRIVSITPACLSDGSYQITMVIENNGAGDITSDFVVRLADNDGHSVDQNFTAIGGTLPLAAGSQQTVIFNNWVVDCAPTTINFSGTLDPASLICESNNGDNTGTGTVTINDLSAVSVVPASSCSADGAITGTMVVTVANTGGNAINSDFSILVDDGQGWTSELFYNADLGGTLPIAPGASSSVTFNWTRNFSATPYVCSFPAIAVTVDSQNAICECTSGNNTNSANYSLPFPDLAITSVASAVVCLGDGSLTGTTVTAANTGCTDASNVVVRLSSDCGLTFSDQTISLAAGESRDVIFNFTSGIVGCTCNFTASIDPDNAICELDGGNNTRAGALPLSIPDITVAGDSLAAACSTDGAIRIDGRVSLRNLGCGVPLTEDISVRFTLYGEAGCRGRVLDQWTQVFSGVNIAAAGGSQNFAVRAHEISQDLCSLVPGCRLSVRVETDFNQQICEWDGTNNDRCANIDLSCLDLAFTDVSWQCQPSGAIQFTMNVTNQGNSAANNALIRIYDEAPALIFENRLSIAAGATVTLRFTSAAYPPGNDHTFRLVIDETNEICECNGQNNMQVATVNCPVSGEPRLEIKKTCPPAQQPGGIFRFEIEVRNTGDGRVDDVEIEDVLPAPLQYVSGSSALDGKPLADPSGTAVLTWKIGKMAGGESHILTYSLIAPADADPGRYCNQAQVRGTAQDGRRSESEKTTCCIILRREAAGCCLVIEERPMGFVQYPELALAYIEPYFHTEKAMFASYAALHLWENIDFEKGSLPDFVRERLKNYALSNVEELYFNSRLGLTLPDGSLWLSYAGDYPQKETGRWKEKNTMRSMTPAQVAFELLAMNKAVAREEKTESKDKLNDLIARRLDFVAARVSDLPERWEFADGQAVRQKENANLYDRASLYFSMVELGKHGRDAAAEIARQLRKELPSLDNEKFDGRNFREECLFILALKENGEDELAAKKIREFEKLFKAGQVKPGDLTAYALAVYTDAKAGGTLSQPLFAEMKSKFYSDDIGLFAQPQADFRQKIGLETLAPLILAFESQMPFEKDLFATVIYRTIEEAGLFLKKTNLQVQRPPLNLIKNYPFTQEMLPLLTFIKSYDDMAPIFSETAMVQSPHTALSSENLLPVNYTKVFAPQYETDTAKIGLLSFSLQQLGKDLDGSAERAIREQGRSLDQSGKKYVRLLLNSHAGLEWQGDVFLSTAKLAVKGSRPSGVNLDALDSKNEFSTEVLANKLVAEKIFMKNPGSDRQRLEASLEMQEKLVSQFKIIGFVPASFTAFKKNEAGELVMLPSPEKADKLTVAKLQYALPDAFWQQILEKESGVLKAQDLLFLSLAPRDLLTVFEKELRQFISGHARDFAEIAAQVVARNILGLDAAPTRKKLADIWDHETGLPLSARVENMNRGQVFQYQPWQILLYLTATKDNDDFQFKRTLDYFTYLLESEWGMNWSEAYSTLPAAEYWLVKEAPREYPEPGDMLNFNVRVENRCPDGLASAGDLPSLFIKAEFTPSLVFAGTELPANLSLFNEFSWGYQGLQKDSTLQYTYQALIPREFKENYLQGRIWVRGYTGYQAFGPDSASGEYCEAFAQTERLQLLPQDLIPGLVYADRNLNGRKDAGETGIAAIRFKDNRGRLFRSNAEGRFFVPAGQDNVAVQIDFRSIPEDLVLISPPTQLTSRSQRRELTYALVPCHRLHGFVFRDDDRNGRCDENEPRLVGVRLKAGDKECSSGSNGEFIMNNLPDLWRELLKVDKDQTLYSGSLDLVKFQITVEDQEQ